MKVCDRCEKIDNKPYFCCNKCRVSFYRHGKLTASKNSQDRLQEQETASENKSNAPKRTKQELQAEIDRIPAHRDTPDPWRANRGIRYNDPDYNYDRGYDEAAAAVEL